MFSQATLQTNLRKAAKSGQSARVTILSYLVRDRNARDENGRSALWLAAAEGRIGAVKALIKRRVDLDLSDNDHWTPIFASAVNGHSDVINVLSKAGAQCEWFSPEGVSQRGPSPLQHALAEGNRIIEVLVAGGVNVEKQHGDTGNSPLNWAAVNGQEEIAEIFLKGEADMESKNGHGNTPLQSAILHGQEVMFKMLLSRGASVATVNKYGNSPLNSAALSGDKGIVEVLLNSGADVQSQNSYGMSPLCSAATNGHEDIVAVLLEFGADFESQDCWENSALRCAQHGSHAGVVELLLKAGAIADKMVDGESDPELSDKMVGEELESDQEL